MYVLKSFIINTTFANNTPGVVAKLGELSSIGATFSREKGIYSNRNNAPNLTLMTFISKDGDTAIKIPTTIADQVLKVCNFVYNQTLSGQVDILPGVLLENLITNFVGDASDFICGNMVSDGSYTLPEWLSWKCLTDDGHTENFLKVWFVDESFQQQYDEYEIYVIPPFDTLDNFHKPGTEVELLVKALTSSATMDRIQLAKSKYPDTVTRTNTYDYIDPLNSNHVVPTDWSVLIYGPTGDNVDSIKDAIMEHILDRTARTRDEWIKIFPDIFKRTEFIILPLEDQYAIPNRELATGIYSPFVVHANAPAKMKQYAAQYPQPHIDSNLVTFGHPYRSVALLAIGSPDNRNGVFKLNQMFKDFISVTSTSVDFNRMSKKTQDWAYMIEQMLFAAESASQYTTIPVGMTKVRRDGILYITRSYENVNYLVVAKSNMG
jgi:hypothetical protein